MRYLLITADDFGIGDATTQGILKLAEMGRVTNSVLMANSPHVESGIELWHASGKKLELGWHPALTIDGPVAKAADVSSLIDADGRFFPLGTFLKKMMTGAIQARHIEIELHAQYSRCCDLLGGPPPIINGHHHIHIFNPVGAILRDILRQQTPRPYIRRVRESWSTITRIRGARVKRLVLNHFGQKAARKQKQEGFPGSDWAVGVTDPRYVDHPDFFTQWVRTITGDIVELTCHPGLRDKSLIGRDCSATDGMIERRVRELELLADDNFLAATRQAGFTIISPAQLQTITHP